MPDATLVRDLAAQYAARWPVDDTSCQKARVRTAALQAAVLASPDFPIIATDERGIIQLFNAGAERMLGYAASDVVDRASPCDLHDPDEVKARAKALSEELATPIEAGFHALSCKAARGIEDRYELTYVCKDGSRFPGDVTISALRDGQGQLLGYLLIACDTTAHKKVESALTSARHAAERANQAKSDFLSNMSHELRTPLGAILGFAQLVETGTPAPTPQQQRSVDQILKAGWYLLELINEILDLAQIESGRLSLSLEPVSLAEVFAECRSMVEPQAGRREVALHFPVLAAPLLVCADRVRLKQVLVNLLSNAIKYNRPAGRVDVVCAAAGPGRLRIGVQDTGLGLSPDQLGQLFEPFNRLGQEHGGEQGTGIGLVMAKRLVELMDGSIGVHSRPGEGSEFWIEIATATLPAAAPRPAPDAAHAPASADPPAARRKVLYVEDNPSNLMLVEDLLARRGDLVLSSARDGHRGVEMARRLQPDVILMDINLPGITGLKALEMLADDPLTAGIPVVAVSANAMPRDIRIGLEAGFLRYLTKPIRMDEFMDTLDFALAVARARHPGR